MITVDTPRSHYESYPFSSPLRYGMGRTLLLDYLPEEGRVLDAGCGSGRTLRLLSDHAPHLYRTAMDISSVAVSSLPVDADRAVGDVTAMPYRDDSFDAVYSIGVLHHTPAPFQGLDECVRVLRPGGYIVIALYNSRNSYRWIYGLTSRAPEWVQRLFPFGYIQDQLFSPIARFFDPDRVVEELESRGVQVEDIHGTGHYPPFRGRRAAFVYYGGVLD